VKITLPRQVLIVGEIRYCRRIGIVYHAGVLIQDVFQTPVALSEHISNDELSFFLVGRGLSAADIIKLREHLIECQACRIRLGETDAALNPSRRPKS